MTWLFFLVPPVTALGAAMLLGDASSLRLDGAILPGAAALRVLRKPTDRSRVAR